MKMMTATAPIAARTRSWRLYAPRILFCVAQTSAAAVAGGGSFLLTTTSISEFLSGEYQDERSYSYSSSSWLFSSASSPAHSARGRVAASSRFGGGGDNIGSRRRQAEQSFLSSIARRSITPSGSSASAGGGDAAFISSGPSVLHHTHRPRIIDSNSSKRRQRSHSSVDIASRVARQLRAQPLSTTTTTTTAETSQQNDDSVFSGRQTPEESQMTRDCHSIIDAAIAAVNPVQAIQNHVVRQRKSSSRRRRIIEVGASQSSHTDHQVRRTYDLDDYDKILVVAFGKASSAMATAVVDQLVVDDENEDDESVAQKLAGVVIVKDEHASKDEIERLSAHNIQVYEASHPVPDDRGVAASNRLLDLVSDTCSASSSGDKKTLVMACISGGGSALFCTPHKTLTLDDIQRTNQFLLQSGWSIQEMNILRKRLERGKGGGLLSCATPAGVGVGADAGGTDVVSLVLSDVLGDPLDLIASGPTVPDTSTAHDAWNLVQRVPNYENILPPAVVQLLEDQVQQEKESHDDNDKETLSSSPFTCLVGNNALAVSAAARQAESSGYTPVVLGTQIEGEASTVAQVLVGMAQHVLATSSSNEGGGKDFAMVSRLPCALIMGGETTVTLPSSCNPGKGGRNQELALAAALALRKYNLRQVVVASVGTDGTDGPTDAAGAIVDGGTIDRLHVVAKLAALNNENPENKAVNALERHDSYHYLAQKDQDGHSPLVKTGPTGTNVADVMVVLVHGKSSQFYR